MAGNALSASFLTKGIKSVNIRSSNNENLLGHFNLFLISLDISEYLHRALHAGCPLNVCKLASQCDCLE